MEPERWQRIGRLYHSALAVEENQRPSFLTGACGRDQTLRREVAALLSRGDADWTALSGDGSINTALAPSVRPDPCQ